MPRANLEPTVRTTVDLPATLARNLEALVVFQRIRGKGSVTRKELLTEAVRDLLTKHGLPTDKEVELIMGGANDTPDR